jgi:hypothetical protein
MANKINLNKQVKNVLIIGDSYSTFQDCVPEGHHIYYTGAGECGVNQKSDTWWYKLIEMTGANLIRNDSWSGATICYTGRVSPEFAYNSSFVNRMHLLVRDRFFEREKIDTILVFGGTNDSWLETTPKGEIKLSDWSEEDLYFSLPAICYMAAKLKATLPDGNIIFIINTDLDERITSAIKLASEHFGTSYIELENINKQNGHPTPKGMRDIAEQIFNAIS